MATLNHHVPQPGTGSPPFLEVQHTTMAPTHDTSFALLALNGTSRIRALHFPSNVYSQMIKAIKHTWPEGIEWATLRSDDGWTCLLKGTPWKKKASEELESIRLVLGLLHTLSREGWSLVQDVKVGSARKDVHHFVFRHDELDPASDRFFAISFPLPERISLVDPPATSTPAIISSIRSAVMGPEESLSDLMAMSTTDKESHTNRFGRKSTKVPEAATPIHHYGGEIKIKREGWEGTGVYGFDLKGYSVFAGKGFDDFKYDAHHPNILLSLIANLNRNHCYLVLSLRLNPHKHTRRDVLILMDTNYEGCNGEPLEEFPVPPRLSFPRTLAAPPFNIPANTGHNTSRFIRNRPASMASLNGRPLLPSIPASPSWEEDDRHHNTDATAAMVRHKKSSHLPGQPVVGEWHSPLKMPMMEPLDATDVLRPSFEEPTASPHRPTPRTVQAGAASPPFLSTFPSDDKIDVKEVTAAHTVYILEKAPTEEDSIIRRSARPEFGEILEDASVFRKAARNSTSGDKTATLSPDRFQSLAVPQDEETLTPATRLRKGLRELLKAVL